MTLNRLALAALCVLPALAVKLPAPGAPGAPMLATFMYACDSDEPRPSLTTRYTGEGRPSPKDKAAQVFVYEHGSEPTRGYKVIGEVRVLANSSRTSADELKSWAQRGARELGGDAVVSLVVDDAAALKAGPVGVLCATASVAQWQ